MRTVAFCEIDPFCRAVLAKHWPDVPIHGDIRTLTAESLMADADDQGELQQGGAVGQERRWPGDRRIEVICGGFPCQDISVAGAGAGIEGERSGLWSEYARIIGEVRPHYVIVENVAALLGRGLDRVLGDLAALGYDAEWHCIPASAVGAPHRRDRIWIVAYARSDSIRHEPGRRNGACGTNQTEPRHDGSQEFVAHADRHNQHGRGGTLQMGWGWRTKEIADDGELGRTQWGVEPDVGRVAHGVPARVHRLRALGNAVVPQIPEIIGRAIMKAEL
jgi:DNA (cytosine-5)-methyltransferase 1